MKPPASYTPPRKLAARKKQFRLDLRRSKPAPEPETERKSHFWKWVALVALLHVLVIGVVAWIYRPSANPPTPEPFISLVPAGDVVKGTPGTQSAPKIGPSTPAPSVQHSSPPPTPVAVKPPAPHPAPPKPVVPPVVKTQTPPIGQDQPPPKPAPVKPKVKVDLSQLVDGPAPTVTKPVKPKPAHPKKHVSPAPTDEANAPDRNANSSPDSTGLSAQDIAQKLGNKMQAAGIQNATQTGTSGSEHSQANPFADFYLSVRDQVMSKWQHPNLDDETAVNPKVMIHVNPDGTVPPESVTLVQSSGNPAYDDSALTAARSLGHLVQPLPDGCPPDISITFKLTR
jgi:TonB family protein